MDKISGGSKEQADTRTSVDPKQLEQAFSLFNQVSAQLTDAYLELQQQVERLTSELAVANGALRKEFEEKAALSQRLGLLLEALPGGVVVVDSLGIVEQANPAACQMFGGVLTGRSWAALEHEFLQPLGSGPEYILAGEGPGSERRVAVQSSALNTEGARILLIHDVTEAHEMQSRLERHQRLSSMGEMAAKLAHQLRTPLATALLYTANLCKPQLGESERVRFAEKSLVRLRHLERLIQDMLSFVRGETAAEQSGAGELVDVESLTAELAQVMEPQLLEREITFEVSSTLTGAQVKGDRKALAGALLNLLENAAQATPPGGTISLRAECESEVIRILVKDSGRGMDASVLERLFEPFFTTRSDGTGLGLAIVRNVISSHGGEIQVESSPGRGSLFVCLLPRAVSTGRK